MVFNDYCTGPYYDDFSDPTSGWPVASGPDLIYRYLNGEYNIYHVNDNQWTAVTAGHEWDNRTVQVDGRVNAGDGVYGLILGIAPDWSRFFTFEIDPVTGSWYLLRYTSASGWQLVRSGQSSAINSNWNTLRATNRELYVNNASITDFYDLNPNGRVGFTSASFEDDSDFRYDDYYYVRGSCPEPPGAQSYETAPSGVATGRSGVAPSR